MDYREEEKWFQQNGAICHIVLETTTSLTETFNEGVVMLTGN